MTIDRKDLEQFESKYRKETREILVLTSDATDGAGRGRGEALWSAIKFFLAYVDAETGELFKGNGRLVWPLTEEDRIAHGSAFPYFFEGGVVYRLRSRELADKTVGEGMSPSFYNQFLVGEVLEKNVRNDALQAVLEDYRKPVTITDEALGEFVLDKNLGMFEGSVAWLGDTVGAYLHVTVDSKASWTKALKALRTLFGQREQRDAEFRAFAAKRLVGLANEWRDEEDGGMEITEKDFAARISLSELSVTSGGAYTAYYDDDDMFAGHVIAVSGSLRAGLKSARIEG